MALHWNLGDIADYKAVCFIDAKVDQPMDGIKKGERVMSPVTNALIWATIPVGLGGITEQNYATFALRLRAIENAFGAFLQKPVDAEGNEVTTNEAVVKWVDRRITLAEVKAHIGLGTNASRLTDAKFKAELAARMLREAGHSVSHEQNMAAVAALQTEEAA